MCPAKGIPPPPRGRSSGQTQPWGGYGQKLQWDGHSPLEYVEGQIITWNYERNILNLPKLPQGDGKQSEEGEEREKGLHPVESERIRRELLSLYDRFFCLF